MAVKKCILRDTIKRLARMSYGRLTGKKAEPRNGDLEEFVLRAAVHSDVIGSPVKALARQHF